jgi:GntR family transcriptional repressor for pyruvate dehydrogenase complex
LANFKPVQSVTLSRAIAEQIMDLIAGGQIKPGDRLPPEHELMEQFSVSRSTLREALKSLAMVGIIEARRSAGTFVSETYMTGILNTHLNWAVMFSEREVSNIVEVRVAIEGETAALAAQRATPQQRATLAHLLAAMEDRSLDAERMTEYDTAFHLTIAEASQNALLHNLILSVRNLIRDYMLWGFQNQVDIEDNAQAHRKIYEAIQAGRPREARQAMLDHLNHSAAWIMEAARSQSLRRRETA